MAVQKRHAVVHGLVVHAPRGTASTDAACPFEHDRGVTRQAQLAREGQAGDPGADDDDVVCGVRHGSIVAPNRPRGAADRIRVV